MDKDLDVPGLSFALKNERNGIYITGYLIEKNNNSKLKLKVLLITCVILPLVQAEQLLRQRHLRGPVD